MKLLFIAKYCPAHFQNILLYFSLNQEKESHQIHFFSEYRHQELSLKNINYTNIRFPKVYYKGNKAEQTSIRLLRRGLIFTNALNRLKNSGFVPDFIFCDSSHATSFGVHSLFPDVPTITYCDWFLQQPEFDEKILKNPEATDESYHYSLRVNNMFQIEAMRQSSKLVTFSNFQRNSFPEFLRKKISVIHEGVNTDFFRPSLATENSVQEKQQYDFLKGYEHNDIILFAPRIFKKSPELQVIVKALKELFYKKPNAKLLLLTRSKLVQEDFMQVFAEFEEGLGEYKNNIIIHRNASVEEYKGALMYSTVQLFMFDQLFISPSLYEAFACGNIVIAQKNPALEEFIAHGKNAYISQYADSKELTTLLQHILENKEEQTMVKSLARKTAVTHFSLKTEVKKVLKLIESIKEKI